MVKRKVLQTRRDTLLAIKNVKIYTISNGIIPGTVVIDEQGKIAAVGGDVEIPRGAEVIDGTGKVLMPGMIEPHGHAGGVYEESLGWEGSDGNEMTDPSRLIYGHLMPSTLTKRGGSVRH